MATIRWINAGSGSWSVAANWSGGVVPAAGDSVTLATTNAYTVTLDVAAAVRGLSVTDAAAALVLDQELSVGRTLGLAAGSLQINGGGGIEGGTLDIGTAASALLNGGSLTNVTVHGTLADDDAGGYLSGNITFAGATGTGAGQFYFNDGNFYALNYLYTEGNTRLDGATLTIGNTGPGGSTNILYAQDTGTTGATLTLGKDFTLLAPYGNSALQGSDGAHDSIVNDGTISAAGGHLQIDATRFTNKGVITTASGGVLFFTGPVAAGLVDSVQNQAGGYTGIDGTVTGGTLVTPDGQVGSWGGGGELDGVTVQGTFTLQDSPFYFTGKNVFTGTGGTGAGTLNYDNGNYYADNYVYAVGDTSLTNVQLNIGNTGTGGSSNILYASDGTSNATGTAALTLGKTFVLNAVAGNSGLQGEDGAHDSITNDGTIQAVTSGATLDLDATKFVNRGVIEVANGGVIYVTGTLDAGLLDSATVGSGGYLGIDGTVTGGTLVTPDGQIGSFGGSGALDGVTVLGTLTIEDGGFTLTGRNSFANTGGGGAATLNFDQGNYESANDLTALGSQTLDNAVLNIGNTGLYGSSNILFSKDGTGNGATLTLGANFTLNAVQGNSGIAGTDGAKDAIINRGTINAATAGGALDIDGSKFTNDGTINTASGGVVYFTGTYGAGLLDSVTVQSGGYAGIDGVLRGGTLVTPTGQIGSFGGSGELDGVAVHGTLTIEDGGFTITGRNGFAGSNGSGTATINFDQGISYDNPTLTALGSTELNNATLNIGDTGLGGATNVIFSQDPGTTGATLTLGGNFTLNAVSGNSALGGTDGAHDKIVNDGTITAVTTGGDLNIDATRFENKGTILTGGGGVLLFSGAIDAGLVNSVVNTTGGYTGIDGTVTGGTINGGDGQVGSINGDGVLDNVSVTGTFNIDNGTFTVEGSTSFAGATETFDSGESYADSYLYAHGDVTLNDTTINIGNTGLGGSSNIIYNQDSAGTGATLTLGAGFVLNAVYGNSGIAGTDGASDSIVLNGTLNVYDGATLTIDETRFTDNGVINVAPGGVLHMTGTPAETPAFNAAALTSGHGLIALHGTGDAVVLGTAACAAAISGFGAGDTIEITGQTIAGLRWTQTSAVAGTLLLTGASGTLGDLVLRGSYSQADFTLAANGHEIGFAGSGFVADLPVVAQAQEAVAIHPVDELHSIWGVAAHHGVFVG